MARKKTENLIGRYQKQRASKLAKDSFSDSLREMDDRSKMGTGTFGGAEFDVALDIIGKCKKLPEAERMRKSIETILYYNPGRMTDMKGKMLDIINEQRDTRKAIRVAEDFARYLQQDPEPIASDADRFVSRYTSQVPAESADDIDSLVEGYEKRLPEAIEAERSRLAGSGLSESKIKGSIRFFKKQADQAADDLRSHLGYIKSEAQSGKGYFREEELGRVMGMIGKLDKLSDAAAMSRDISTIIKGLGDDRIVVEALDVIENQKDMKTSQYVTWELAKYIGTHSGGGLAGTSEMREQLKKYRKLSER